MPSRIPKSPVLGWGSFAGESTLHIPCVLHNPNSTLTTSGRASILLALEKLNIGEGDRVLVPTYHCRTMIAPLVVRGARPIFYSIGAKGEVALDELQANGAKAILAAHFFGLPQPLKKLRKWCDTEGVAMIEDCAHSLFGSSDGRAVGSWGDLAIASLTKFLPVSEGGILIDNRNSRGTHPRLWPAGAMVGLKAVTDTLQLAATHRKLVGFNTIIRSSLAALHWSRNLSRPASRETARSGINLEADMRIDVKRAHRTLAWPSKWITEKVPLAKSAERRKYNYEYLSQALSGQKNYRPLFPAESLFNLADVAPYALALWIESPDPGYSELRQESIAVARWDRVWPGLRSSAGDFGPLWSHHVLQILCHQDLSPAHLDFTIKTIKRIYK
jgi:perosamine synthetase